MVAANGFYSVSCEMKRTNDSVVQMLRKINASMSLEAAREFWNISSKQNVMRGQKGAHVGSPTHSNIRIICKHKVSAFSLFF